MAVKISEIFRRHPGINIGVVGYCPPSQFDKAEAARLLVEAFDRIKQEHPEVTDFVVVSGLANVGIIALAYSEATRRNWKTAGIACAKVLDFELFPVNFKQIVGENWGDESLAFVGMLDVIIRVGGGPQSLGEVQMARKQGIFVIEYKLPKLN